LAPHQLAPHQHFVRSNLAALIHRGVAHRLQSICETLRARADLRSRGRSVGIRGNQGNQQETGETSNEVGRYPRSRKPKTDTRTCATIRRAIPTPPAAVTRGAGSATPLALYCPEGDPNCGPPRPHKPSGIYGCTYRCDCDKPENYKHKNILTFLSFSRLLTQHVKQYGRDCTYCPTTAKGKFGYIVEGGTILPGIKLDTTILTVIYLNYVSETP
jgi:hypothetical protein